MAATQTNEEWWAHGPPFRHSQYVLSHRAKTILVAPSNTQEKTKSSNKEILCLYILGALFPSTRKRYHSRVWRRRVLLRLHKRVEEMQSCNCQPIIHPRDSQSTLTKKRLYPLKKIRHRTGLLNGCILYIVRSFKDDVIMARKTPSIYSLRFHPLRRTVVNF